MTIMFSGAEGLVAAEPGIRVPDRGAKSVSRWKLFRTATTARSLGMIGLGLILPVLVVALWAVTSRYEWVASQILPAPSVVAATAMELATSGQLHSELLVSLARLLIGVVAGGATGIAFGLMVGLSPRAEDYLMPLARAIWSVPSLGWLPFCMLVFGIGETLKIVLIAKACFLPVMINTFEGTRNIPEKYKDVASILELSRADRLRYLVLPAVTPSILNGLRLSLSKGWHVLVLVEMIASAAGIGYLMTFGRKSFQLDIVLVTIVVIGIAGAILDRFALIAQKHFAGWAVRSTM